MVEFYQELLGFSVKMRLNVEVQIGIISTVQDSRLKMWIILVRRIFYAKCVEEIKMSNNKEVRVKF